MTEEMVKIIVDGAIECCQVLAGGFIIGQLLRSLFGGKA